MKWCNDCCEYQPLENFYAHKTICKPCSVVASQEWKAANPERLKELRKRYQKSQRVNPNYRAEDNLANPASMTRKTLTKKAFKRRDRQKLKERTPSHWAGWKGMREEILDIYMRATELAWAISHPIHVDHIIPLKGATVSGLHVPANLRIIPAHINEGKGATYIP